MLLGIAFLFIVSGAALCIWVGGLPLSWTADYDKATYARIIKVIAADPQHLGGRRLCDVSRELGLDDVPWDDGNAQNLPGSYRVYHFHGFAIYVSLDYNQQGVTEDMLMGRGSVEENLRARDLLRLDPHHPPFALIDGISSREERMRQYWARIDKEIREINRQMEADRQQRFDRQN